MSVNPRDLLFYAGGECLQRFGTLVWRPRLAHDLVPTFTRSGAVGPFIGSDGVLRQASANRPRVEWVNGTDPDGDGAKDKPGLLLEKGATNLIDSDDITAWSVGGTPGVTGSVDDPAGGTGAYTIEDADGAALEFVVRNISFTGDAAKSFTFVVRENTMPASGTQVLKVRDTSAAADRLLLSIASWSDGDPQVTATTGTLVGKQYVGNGYWAIYGLSTTITAANTNRVEILPASGDAAYTGIIDVYRVNAYDSAAGPVSSILDASEALAQETMYVPFTAAPQEMTIYSKHVERGTLLADSQRLWQIGAANSATDPRMGVIASGGFYRMFYDDGIGLLNATLSAAPSYGDVVEIRAVLRSDGGITIGQSINGGAETTATGGASLSFGSAWADTRIYLNSGGTSLRGNTLLMGMKAVAGTKTMAEMRNIFPRAAS